MGCFNMIYNMLDKAYITAYIDDVKLSKNDIKLLIDGSGNLCCQMIPHSL